MIRGIISELKKLNFALDLVLKLESDVNKLFRNRREPAIPSLGDLELARFLHGRNASSFPEDVKALLGTRGAMQIKKILRKGVSYTITWT